MQKQPSLPTLPTIKKKREASVTPKILEWFREHHSGSCAIEVKATKKDTIPASALATHQLQALQQVSSSSLVYKISDEGRGRKPFDAFMLERAQAYVVCCFTTHHVALVIPVDKWKGARYDDTALYSIRLR